MNKIAYSIGAYAALANVGLVKTAVDAADLEMPGQEKHDDAASQLALEFQKMDMDVATGPDNRTKKTPNYGKHDPDSRSSFWGPEMTSPAEGGDALSRLGLNGGYGLSPYGGV